MTVAYYTFIVPSIATTPYPSPNIKPDKEYRRSQPSNTATAAAATAVSE